MPGTRPNPTASRRALVTRLRSMRLAAGKSTEDAARELMVSASKVSRLESGDRTPQPRDVRDLARFYGASHEEIAELQALLTESRRKGWWAHYGTLDEQADVFIGLETAATRIEAYESMRWCGLLQSPDVVREIFSRYKDATGRPDNFIEDQVKLRLERQQRLFEGALALHVILDESVFYRAMGRGVRERQIRHLLHLCHTLENLTLQIVPFSAGSYYGTDGAFWVLRDLSAFESDDLVFIEGLLGHHNFVDRESVVIEFKERFQVMAKSYAMTPPASLQWIEALESRLGG